MSEGLTKRDLITILERVKSKIISGEFEDMSFDERLYVIGKVIDIIARIDKQGVNKNGR